MVGTKPVLAACLAVLLTAALAAGGPAAAAPAAAGPAGTTAPHGSRPAALATASSSLLAASSASDDGAVPSASASEGDSALPSSSDAPTPSPSLSEAPSASASPTPSALMPVLRGAVLDLDGLPLDMSGGHLQLDETLGRDASTSWHTLVPVGADGTFAVRVMPWGDAAAPVRLTLSFGPSDYVAPVVTTSDGATCYRWTGLTGILRLDLALGDGSETSYAVVRATRTAEEEICGAQGTPSPTPRRSSLASPVGPSSPESSATPPATSTADGGDPGSTASLAIAILLLVGAGSLTIARMTRVRRR